jgi:ParB family chromosome partitioning protein
MVKKKIEDEYQDVDLGLIDEPDGRIRLEINEEDIESLADNIREVGQIQPINLAIKGKRFEIIAGHLRYLAITKLGRNTIKAIVKKVPKKEIALVRASENLKRHNLSPIEEGAIYADLVDEHGMTKMGIAEKFAVPASTIRDKMGLLNLHSEIQKLIHKGLIYINVGQELNKIDNERQLKKCLADAVNNGCKIETAMIWVQDYKKSLTYEPTDERGGSPMAETLTPQKIYQACELCENPVEIQDMKIIRICPGCYKVIVENLKQGGQL